MLACLIQTQNPLRGTLRIRAGHASAGCTRIARQAIRPLRNPVHGLREPAPSATGTAGAAAPRRPRGQAPWNSTMAVASLNRLSPSIMTCSCSGAPAARPRRARSARPPQLPLQQSELSFKSWLVSGLAQGGPIRLLVYTANTPRIMPKQAIAEAESMVAHPKQVCVMVSRTNIRKQH